MFANRVLLGVLAGLGANAASAGTVPLGAQLGEALGRVAGIAFGAPLPFVEGGLLTVAAVSLLIGIRIAKRKKNR